MTTDATEIELFNTHAPTQCSGRPCTLHRPTNHGFRDRAIRWNQETGVFLRECFHNEWVLDPDQYEYLGEDRIEPLCCGYTLKGGPRIRCEHCDDIIRSMHRHDYKVCSCGATAVDGGTAYTRLIGAGVVVD